MDGVRVSFLALDNHQGKKASETHAETSTV